MANYGPRDAIHREMEKIRADISTFRDQQDPKRVENAAESMEELGDLPDEDVIDKALEAAKKRNLLLKERIAALDHEHKAPGSALALALKATTFESTMAKAKAAANDTKVEELEAQLRKVAIAGMDDETRKHWREKTSSEEWSKHFEPEWQETMRIANEIQEIAGLPPIKVDPFLSRRREEAKRQADRGTGVDESQDDLYTASPPRPKR